MPKCNKWARNSLVGFYMTMYLDVKTAPRETLKLQSKILKTKGLQSKRTSIIVEDKSLISDQYLLYQY